MELQNGTDLTREGKFADAIPHLLAARGHVADEYAASFNLALCYVAKGQSKLAIPIVEQLQKEKPAITAVWNLSAQAYVGDAQPEKALAALRHAAQIMPNDARLYSYVADACTAAHDNSLGLKVVDLGLRNVPRSPRLHYERAVFLTALDRFTEAKKDFHLASQLGQNTDIGYLASVHESLVEGDLGESIREAREAISKGKDNYILLSLYAEALFRSGVYPGSPGLTEAERAAEKSIAQRSDYAPSRITLGKLYRIDHRLDDSIAQLEAARKLDPQNPAVYANLATAYRLKGDRASAHQALAVLERLNQKQVTAIRDSGTKTGERRGNVSAVQNR
ncbi:MAG TPA: tetratricopeptide repeat protein [Candidatus Acidoferrum sp.]|nr:tetratricopeptide repeat protein [Candidatus Acidoferrum sp.]